MRIWFAIQNKSKMVTGTEVRKRILTLYADTEGKIRKNNLFWLKKAGRARMILEPGY